MLVLNLLQGNVVASHATQSSKSSGCLFGVDFFLYILSLWTFHSIVYDNEFSARLSFGSILRLRAAAITALSQDTKTDKATIFRLARRFLNLSVCQRSGTEVNNPASDVYHGAITGEDLNHQVYESEYLNDSQGSSACFSYGIFHVKNSMPLSW